jgi:hypothetical protein
MLKFSSKLASVLFVGGIGLSIVQVSHAADSPEQLAKALVAKYVALKNAKDTSKMSEIYTDNYIERSGRNPQV